MTARQLFSKLQHNQTEIIIISQIFQIVNLKNFIISTFKFDVIGISSFIHIAVKIFNFFLYNLLFFLLLFLISYCYKYTLIIINILLIF